ncbi:uncharacterized protein TM35_000084690 [Trypanosoma theileri]|uniref:Histone chaperone ASF1 n=1 Tax=Trypanosoma theileri TaxID=67003 RepID=A0A1X0P1H0_9TRYP|nr:uncharacterized protein TM35_000084690 [Trypanosoma theileri]ORC90671.1 hypothetical protein TM35_000084690 [Trypanosoma theileri]
MTTRVSLCGVSIVGNNPAAFDEPISVKVLLEVFEKPPTLPIDVKFVWNPIWDFPVEQELDAFEVGPLTTLGRHELTLQSDPPDFAKIPDPTGPTALIITFSYDGREFLHLGYNAIVTCEGEMPDVFLDAGQLRRHLTQCFPKQTMIVWDTDDCNGGNNNDNGNGNDVDVDDDEHDEDDEDVKGVESSHDEDESPPAKKAKHN